jgi:hypothetical protein
VHDRFDAHTQRDEDLEDITFKPQKTSPPDISNFDSITGYSMDIEVYASYFES